MAWRSFQEVIENLPTDTGMAFVLLSHILRGSKSLLPEILARSTRMPVSQVAETGQRILADHVYAIPPDRFMEIDGDTLVLIRRPDRPVNTAIDHFLLSGEGPGSRVRRQRPLRGRLGRGRGAQAP